MKNKPTDPAGWNRIADLEERLRDVEGGRSIERAALERAMDRIANALDYIDRVVIPNRDTTHDRILADLRGILDGHQAAS